MHFQIRHKTRYAYADPATESVGELRLAIPSLDSQVVHERSIQLDPDVRLFPFFDYFGNMVEAFSVYFRHTELTIEARALVETYPAPDVGLYAGITVGEARQLANSRVRELFPYSQASHHVPLHRAFGEVSKGFFRSSETIGESALALNRWIYESFRYDPRATEISTPVDEVLACRAGVCQDFAHVMLMVCRMNRIPARYVSGFIEPGDPESGVLVGATATHAWVEVGLPGGVWWGLDPTNNQVAGERHVVLAVGRDYADVAPVRGRFKGTPAAQAMTVEVEVNRCQGAQAGAT